MKITFSIITLLVISCLTFSQTIERSYTVQLQIPAGTSATYSIPISDAPSNGVITGVEAKFEYIAYNGAQSYLSARFNRGSDPGPSGGVLLVAQGNLPPGNPGTYGYIPFSNWNGNGVNTNYYFRFTVAAGSPYNPTIVRIWTKVNYNIPPPVPIPVRPLANAQIYSQTPTFQWQYVPNQTDFRLVIYNHPSGAQQYIQINQTGGSSNSYTLNQAQKLEAGDYWWKVNIATPSGTSPYTSLIHFTVTAPIPIAPVNQTVNTSRPTFSWSTIPNQTHFRVAIYNHPSGGDPYMVRNYEGGSSNSWKCDVDLPNGQYWWKVNVAVSTEAGNSPYCELKTFSVQTTQLNLVSPTYNQNIYGGNIVLQWTNVNADSYHVYVDNNIIPGPPGVYSSPEINKKKVTTNNYIIDEYFLECNQTFYWRIVAFLPGGTQINSDVGVFNYYFGQNLEPQPIWAPLYRLYKSADKDHFYCVSPEQRQIAINQGYKDERIEGHISVKPFNDLNMVNIFRLYHPSLKAHYYTTDGDDKDIKIQTGYTYEGIIGFAYSNNRPELIPFYQLHKDFSNPSSIDHFYTCSFPEKDNAVKVFGFIYDGIIAFISPNGNNQTLPLGPGQLEAGLGVNTANGNFRHYTKTSFNIPGKGIPLVFEHFYNSNSVWLYAGIIPLSPGWSHSYNSYVVTLNPEEVNQNVAVVWPDGSIKEYYYNGTNYAPQTPGDYDIFNVIAGVTHFTIKKKDQSIYTFMTPPGAPFGYPAMLTSIKDRNNNITSLSYETSPIIRLKEVTDPSGRKFTFNYYTESGKEYLIKNVIDNTGNRTIQFIYDEQNRLVQFKDAENRITEYLYDSTWEQFHLLSKITLPKGNVIDISYQTDPDPDGIGMRVNQQLINGGNQVNFSYNYSTKSTTVSDANNIQYRYEYNSNSLITNVYNETLSKVDKFWYQDPDNPTKPTQTQDKNGNYSTFQYDLRGNVLQINQVAGGKTITHKYQYDAMNNITKYTDPRNKVTDFVYDNNGNLISVTDTRGTTNYSRNSFGKVESITNPLSHTTNLGYNSYGNLTTITDPLSNTTSLTYDAISRLKSVLNPKNQNTQYSYDKTDLLLTITDAFNNNTTYSYDANSNLTNILNARGFSTNFGYDNFERLISKAEPSSNPTQFSYRSNGQIASRTNPDGSTVTYSYNADRISGISSNNVNATFNYDGNGNITSVIESGNYKGSGTLSFSYDEINRLTGYTDFYSKSVGYTYDESGNILSITYPGNKTVFYTYYDDNRLSSVKDWNGKTTTYNYRNDGSLYQISYPNGVVVTYSYDNAERITGINISGYSGSIASYSFELDFLGNHTKETITQPLTPLPNLANSVINYAYNPANRIEYAGGTTFNFDQNGNMTTKSINGISTNYEYNTENQLVKVTEGNNTYQYVYDIFGNRRAVIKNGIVTNYVLDISGSMSQVLMETDAAGNPINYYVYGLGLVSRIKADGTTHYYLGDFRGSTIAMTNSAGTVTHKYSYDTFGNVIEQVEPDYNPFKYVGLYGVMEEQHGLQFMRARYYDPEIGRFISEDPIWDVNLYNYSNNNPLIKFDPKGSMPEWLYDPLGSIMTDWLYEHTTWADNKKLLRAAKIGRVIFTIGASLTPAGAAIALGSNSFFITAPKIWYGELTQNEAIMEIAQVATYLGSMLTQDLIDDLFNSKNIDFLRDILREYNRYFGTKKALEVMDFYFHYYDLKKAIQE